MVGTAPFVVVVREPSVTRSAVARLAGTTVLVVGGRPAQTFESAWLPSHFEGVQRLL